MKKINRLIRKNAYSASRYLYKAIKIDKDKIIASNIISEGIEFQPAENEQGGMIIFSTEVNAVELAQKYELIGWTVGKFLSGRYTDRTGKVYDENSLSVEVVGINSETLINLAEDICRDFEQETVLVKDYNSQKILFVNGK